MPTVTWQFIDKLEDDSPICKLEKAINVKLPSDYVNCVKENNAGFPSLKIFNTVQGTERVFSNLLSFNSDDDENIFNDYQFLLDETDRKDVLPFARDSFGNYICFDFSDNPIKVVFWNHENKTFDDVSNSFTELLNMLR